MTDKDGDSGTATTEVTVDYTSILVGAVSGGVRIAAGESVKLANMADTFAAFGRDPDALRSTLEKAPPTLDVSIASLRVQRPFLVDTSDLSHRLRPAAQELPRSAPAITSALRSRDRAKPPPCEPSLRSAAWLNLDCCSAGAISAIMRTSSPVTKTGRACGSSRSATGVTATSG